MPGEHAGVSFRSSGDPILYINNPPGVSKDVRRRTLDGVKILNEMNYHSLGDPETHTRLSQYEMAFRMQASVPDLIDLSTESKETLDMYGVGDPLTDDYGRRCLLARRLVEKGVRFVCVVSGGGAADTEWDAHSDIERNHPRRHQIAKRRRALRKIAVLQPRHGRIRARFRARLDQIEVAAM